MPNIIANIHNGKVNQPTNGARPSISPTIPNTKLAVAIPLLSL
jgi:hypothetical protein